MNSRRRLSHTEHAPLTYDSVNRRTSHTPTRADYSRRERYAVAPPGPRRPSIPGGGPWRPPGFEPAFYATAPLPAHYFMPPSLSYTPPAQYASPPMIPPPEPLYQQQPHLYAQNQPYSPVPSPRPPLAPSPRPPSVSSPKPISDDIPLTTQETLERLESIEEDVVALIAQTGKTFVPQPPKRSGGPDEQGRAKLRDLRAALQYLRSVWTTVPEPEQAPTSNDINMDGTVRRALVIGIDYVGTSNELHGCAEDAINMLKFLQARGYSECTLMTDRAVSLDIQNTLTQGILLPTKINILSQLKRVLAPTSNGEPLRVFVHYSGHGTSTPDVDGDEEDGNDEALVPLDYRGEGSASLITDDELRELLTVECRKFSSFGSGGTLDLKCLFDCCHSGSVLDLPVGFSGSRIATYSAFMHTDAVNITLISGCLDPQTSADTPSGGACTRAFIQCVDRARSQRELVESMLSWLRAGRFGQVPNLTSLHDHKDEPYTL